MLELIFQGFFEWIYGMILEAWEFFSGKLIDLMSMDFSYLQTHIPVLPVIRQSMLAVGWALLLGNLVFQAMRSMMTGLGFEAEDPKLLFTRTFVFSFLLLASPQICELCLNMTSIVVNIMGLPDAVNIDIIHESAFDGLACAWLLVFICGVIVMFQSFKLIFEMAERYFILAVLTITAPLAFGMGGSRNTSDIFTGWCRMYGSMCLLMVLNVVFVKMLL
ncbi:MAG: type IV secretion system protein, partial [Oscillospiraceae bacterium]|nr:type IV secretion system protein [Oscillospiraceae bacterium]